jgi:hypothetical protein
LRHNINRKKKQEISRLNEIVNNSKKEKKAIPKKTNLIPTLKKFKTLASEFSQFHFNFGAIANTFTNSLKSMQGSLEFKLRITDQSLKDLQRGT